MQEWTLDLVSMTARCLKKLNLRRKEIIKNEEGFEAWMRKALAMKLTWGERTLLSIGITITINNQAW